jgi:hypothetical protein
MADLFFTQGTIVPGRVPNNQGRVVFVHQNDFDRGCADTIVYRQRGDASPMEVPKIHQSAAPLFDPQWQIDSPVQVK